ncbi:MAG: aspartyl/asparaginyl beta-hydroxylase domain-containing protein [Alphaproteobacteria bacterium]|nr:aspartyl/asparaginyl beta-hydroxylase domain-containing protein [Alphaproteobacteria bacterium]
MQPLSNQEAERIVRAGAAALQQGRPDTARAEFEKVAASGRASAQVWLLLAHACRQAGDAAAAEAALDRLLAAEPQNLWALIQKGDARAAAGDGRAATAFHKKARQVAAMVAPLPPELAREMERVERAIGAAERHYRDHLERELAARGFGPAARSPRFQQSLDILAGEKQIYFQQPTNYFFPELPHIQFFDRSLFPWAAAVEAAAADIRAELVALMDDETAFQPYLVAAPNRPRTDFHGLADNPEWSSLYLWEGGRPVEANVARCPKAYEALLHAPMPHISTRAPVVMFSRLRPGARIPAHTGMLNARLICHLPLIVPPNCGFRVGNEVRQWEEGKLLIFDDTIEHEAWNESAEDRVVLIFDIWRPELSEEERAAVAAMFESVDSYGG